MYGIFAKLNGWFLWLSLGRYNYRTFILNMDDLMENKRNITQTSSQRTMTHDWCCAIYACKKGIWNIVFLMVLNVFLEIILLRAPPVMTLQLQIWVSRASSQAQCSGSCLAPSLPRPWRFQTFQVLAKWTAVKTYFNSCNLPSDRPSIPILMLPSIQLVLLLFSTFEVLGSWGIAHMCGMLVFFQLWNSSSEVLEELVSLLLVSSLEGRNYVPGAGCVGLWCLVAKTGCRSVYRLVSLKPFISIHIKLCVCVCVCDHLKNEIVPG